MDAIDEMIRAVTSVLSSGPIENAVKVGALVVGLFVLFWLRRWARQREIEAANRQTNNDRINDQGSIVKENADVSDDAKSAEDQISQIWRDMQK